MNLSDIPLFAFPLIVFLGVILPLLGWLGLHQSRLKSDITEPTKQEIVIQLSVLQTIVASLAVLAVYGHDLDIPWRPLVSVETLAIAALALGTVLTLSILEARRPLASGQQVRSRLRKVSVSDPAWVGVTIYAGFVEEFAYRGVLTLILADFAGYWVAAGFSALAFGLAHLASGWRALPHGIVFALAMQFVVFKSGGLLMAVAAHIIYDLLAAWLGEKLTGPRNNETAT